MSGVVLLRPGELSTQIAVDQKLDLNFRKKILFQKAGPGENNAAGGGMRQTYSPTNRTAAIPMRKRKQRDNTDELIRVEDDVAEQHQSQQYRHVSAHVNKSRSNRFSSNGGKKPPMHKTGLKISMKQH
eukprot:CAMPEP_0170459972 /NCGR_PEP_ID=MMETSP0123-20130129/6489_1 /TAXON_ID=182087 /ORGANISM="Favella ehrenbergii, Strain Fehren 1" /LENGTH=127 /DNA_ID=CAMNT_0010724749 /DNA_START=2089 /DNA_END=2472 /DNA_ORIENTATION=-